MLKAHDNSSKCKPCFSHEVLGAHVFVVVVGSLCVDFLVGSVMMGEKEGLHVGSISFSVGCKIISFVNSSVGER